MIKKLLFYLTIIIVSAISTFVLYSTFYSFYVMTQSAESDPNVFTPAAMYLFFLRLTGTLAFIFIGIATALGALRNFIFSFYRSTTFWKIHTQWASTLGVAFAASHLTIFLLYQSRLKIPL